MRLFVWMDVYMKTEFVNSKNADRKWWLVDLNGATLGRAATQIASVLRGKNKAIYNPHDDVGDFVVVINAEKVHLSGRKWTQKKHYWHTGYIGGIKDITAEKIRESHPERLLYNAVKGMLPHNTLGRNMLKKLKIFAGAEHKHKGQKPKPMTLG
jgi:large subunit ribosomal protein L13